MKPRIHSIISCKVNDTPHQHFAPQCIKNASLCTFTRGNTSHVSRHKLTRLLFATPRGKSVVHHNGRNVQSATSVSPCLSPVSTTNGFVGCASKTPSTSSLDALAADYCIQLHFKTSPFSNFFFSAVPQSQYKTRACTTRYCKY